jgi:NAD(P)-dependent dehydrogenase (short-subunit alcohol dehydrogenase family)
MYDYQGKHVVVVGGATGMGAAAAQQAKAAGASVTVLDVADVSFAVDRFIRIDLRNEASVDAAVKELSATPIDRLFSCAGVADGTGGIMLINFIAQRHLLEGLLASGALVRGASVVAISSTAGFGWEQDLARIKEFLAIPDWAGQVAWVEAHRSDDYMQSSDNYVFSKRAMCAYVAASAYRYLQQGVRINAILPGPTDTPLARANADIWLGFASDYRASLGVKHLTPDEMASVLMFLGSSAASGIAGGNILVDQGHTSSQVTGSFTS